MENLESTLNDDEVLVEGGVLKPPNWNLISSPAANELDRKASFNVT